MKDDELDFGYLDARHDYCAVSKDLEGECLFAILTTKEGIDSSMRSTRHVLV